MAHELNTYIFFLEELMVNLRPVHFSKTIGENMNTLTNHSEKIIGFQGLRGIASILILLSHCLSYKYVGWAGPLGVQLFIMMSGFLSAIHYSNKDIKWKDAVHICRHKLRKYYRLHILTMIISLPISLTILDGGHLLTDIICLITNIFLIQSWIPYSKVYFSLNGVAWYLSLDLSFVFMLPLIIKIFHKIKKNTIKWVIVITIFKFVLSYFATCYIPQSVVHWIIYVCPLSRVLDFFIGFCIAETATNVRSGKYNNTFRVHASIIYFLLFVCMCLLYISSKINPYRIFFNAAWIIPCSLLLFCIYQKENGSVNILKNPFLAAIGNISLELFLIHGLIIEYTRYIIEKKDLHMKYICYAIAIIFSLGISFGLHYRNLLKKCDDE